MSKSGAKSPRLVTVHHRRSASMTGARIEKKAGWRIEKHVADDRVDPAVEGAVHAPQLRRWKSAHQARLSSPPASADPDRYAAAVTAVSSTPSRIGECGSHQRRS